MTMFRALLLVAFLASCGGSSQAVSQDALICIGDSQTAARLAVTLQDTYCYKMAQATGRAALNRGVGGDNTATAMTRVGIDVLQQPGSCVTVMLGANDSEISASGAYDYSQFWTGPQTAAISFANYTTNLMSLVQQIKASGKRVTLLTPWANFNTTNLNQGRFYADAVKDVGMRHNVPVLDADDIQRRLFWGSYEWLNRSGVVQANAPRMSTLQADDLHPSALGHTYIANLCALPQNKDACACRP